MLSCYKSGATSVEKYAPLLHISKQSTFGERHQPSAGDDEVIERPYVDQRERLLQRLCQQLVGPARLGDARRMVVRVMWPESLCGGGAAAG